MELTQHARGVVPMDIAKELGEAGIACLLQLMTDAYIDLQARGCITGCSPEDYITEEWYVHIQEKWRTRPAISLIPIHQKQDETKAKRRGRPPTIDFCFRHRFYKHSYFGAECKLMDENNADHLAAYIDADKGIGRFTSGKYATFSSAGTMIGYVRTGSYRNVSNDLARAMRGLDGRPVLKKSMVLKDFNALYQSRHKRRPPLTKFLCYHLLFAFEP